MDLDDLKNSWKDVSAQVDKQQTLTPKMIDQMTQAKYYGHLKKIAYPEIIGGMICYTTAIVTGINFSILNTPVLKVTGILFILLLIILPIISLLSLPRFNKPGDLNKPYTEMLKNFAIQKIRFHKFQRINITLCYLLLVTVIILLSKLAGGKGINVNSYFWISCFSVGYIFLLFFSKWVSKKYNNALRQAEELLKELAS